MATRAYIGILYPSSREIKYIYCHHDGYIRHVGELLFKHYNSFYHVDNLIHIGDISSLKETEEQTKATAYKSAYRKALYEDNFIKQAFNDWIEYVYLFNASTKRWYVWSIEYKNKMKPFLLDKYIYECRELEGKLDLAILLKDNKLLNKTAIIALWEYAKLGYKVSNLLDTYEFQSDIPKNRGKLTKIIDDEYMEFFKKKTDNNGQCNEQAEKYIAIAWDAVHSLPLKTNNKPQ